MPLPTIKSLVSHFFVRPLAMIALGAGMLAATGCASSRAVPHAAASADAPGQHLLRLASVSGSWQPIDDALFSPREIPSDVPAARIAREAAREAKWVEGAALHVEGRGWQDTRDFWNRLPAKAEGAVPGDVWHLSQNTAGMAVRFATNSERIHARWSGGGAMDHMAATGVSGLDLYVRQDDGGWRFAGVGRPREGESFITFGISHRVNPSGAMREYLVFLPLYQNVSLFELGFDSAAEVLLPSPAEVADAPKPIVFYGTSITQGGCASRTGMAHPAILRRRLNREVINLGFSGSGRMEPVMAELIGELDASMFVLDNLPNLTDELARERIVPFVQILREKHPTTPILLVEDFRPLDARNAILRNAFETLRRAGDEHLYYMEAGMGMGVLGEEGTVDGVHPTDLGYLFMADTFEPHLRRILALE